MADATDSLLAILRLLPGIGGLPARLSQTITDHMAWLLDQNLADQSDENRAT